MMLWLWMGVMTAIALATLWPAFRTRRGDATPDVASARLAIHRDRRHELDLELAAGKIDPSRHDEALRELEETAATDLGVGTVTDRIPSSRHVRGTGIAVIAIVGALAWFTYAYLGTPVQPETDHTVQSVGETEFEALVAQLAARMAEQPDDLDGWMLLGRSRSTLGDMPGAVDAWRQAERLAPDDATVLANLGEAMLMSEMEAGADRIERALVLDGDNPKALWYGGLLAEGRGDLELASLRWQALLDQGAPEEFRRMVDARLDALGHGPAGGIEVTVQVADALAARVQDGATLFVVARDTAAAAGPPLAAVRRGYRAPGVTLTLSDADTMLPGVHLDAHDSLTLVARISSTGNATRTTGDLYGEAAWARGEGPVRVVINRVVE